MEGNYLLLELLVNSIHGILDGDALEIASGDRQAQWEDQVNLLDRRSDKVQLEVVFVIYAGWGGVESPGG